MKFIFTSALNTCAIPYYQSKIGSTTIAITRIIGRFQVGRLNFHLANIDAVIRLIFHD